MTSFKHPDNEEVTGGSALAEAEQDARDIEARDVGEARFREMNAELSGISTRQEKYGVGPVSKGQFESARKLRTKDSFLYQALAVAYNQPITFNVGGQDVTMSLGDLRELASERYQHYAEKLRELRENGASAEEIENARLKAEAYRQLVDKADDVARGKLSPDALSQYIETHGIGQEISKLAASSKDVEVNYTAPQAAEAEQSGKYEGQSTDQVNAGVFNDYGSFS